MQGFFKQLVDLGEERTEAVPTPASDDLSSLDKPQLVEMVHGFERELQVRKAEFDGLREESTKMRNEYDAYKLKIESWQLKMKEARDADRKLIEQLRAAGSTGGTDDLFVKSMNDTISKYKEELRAAKDEVAKEYSRRLETEEARARFEEAKKGEMEATIAKFERTIETMRKAQNLTELKSKASEEKQRKLQADLKDAMTRRTAAEAREREALEKLEALSSSLPSQPVEQHPSASSDASSSEAPAAARPRAVDSDAEQLLRKQLASAQLDAQEARALAQSRLDELEAAGRDAQASIAEAREEAARAATAAQDLQMEMLAAEKTLSDLRASSAAQATKHTAAVAEAEKHIAALQLEKGELQRQLRVVSDDLATLRDTRVQEDRAHEQVLAELRAELASLRAAARARDDAAGAATEHQQRAADAFTSERRQLEAHISTLERRLVEADSVRQGLEENIAATREDLRKRDETFDELRTELEEQTRRTLDAEAQLAANHSAVATREDDVVAREREKQTLKHQLHVEREASERLRRQLAEYDERTNDERSRLNATLERMKDLEGDRSRLLAELRVESQKVTEAAVSMEMAQRMLRDLQMQLADQGTRTADAVKTREDQSAQVRRLEARLRETESRLQTTLDREAAAAAGGASSSAAAARPPLPSAVLTSAFSQSKISWTQSKTAVAVGVFLLILLGFFNSIGNVPTQKGNVSDTETVMLLKEKYAQALQSALSCRDAARSLCPCSPPAPVAAGAK